jgi:hypothetical protein
MSVKICPICQKEFQAKHFNQKICSKNCVKIQAKIASTQYYENNEKHKHLNNKKVCVICGREFIKSGNCQKICGDEKCIKKNHDLYHKKYYEDHAESIQTYHQDYHKEYSKNNKQQIQQSQNKYANERYATDTNFKMRHHLSNQIRHVLKHNSKCAKTLELLGCTIEEFWIHLEKQFKPGMTRENHGLWHIDHIRPCCSFDLSDPEQQKICFHYKNLQPLWAEENLKKGGRYFV